MSESTVVARIGKPHGLLGEVTVQLHTDEPERRLAVGAVLDTEAASGTGVPRALRVRSTRVHNGVWLVAFDEIPDRTGAESLRGTRLVVDADRRAARRGRRLPRGGAPSACASSTPSGPTSARSPGLELGSAQDRLVVPLTDGREVLVPFVAAIVPEVDVEGGRVVLDAPAGLFDLGN